MRPNVAILGMIEAQIPKLPSALKKVGRHITDHPSQVLDQTTRQIAQASDTGSATVVRFYRQIGCDSLLELKLAIAADIAGKQPDVNGRHQAQRRFGDKFIEALKQSVANLEGIDLIDFSGRLVRASRIYVFGVGATELPARTLACRLVDHDLPAFAVSEKGFEAAHHVDRSSVLIYFIHKDSDPQMLQTLRRLRKGGAFVAIITSYPDARSARSSDIVLPAVSSLPTPMFLYQFLIEALITQLTLTCSGAIDR